MNTLVSARESMVAGQLDGTKHLGWLGLDIDEIRTIDPLVNPMLACLPTPKTAWPTRRELSRLRSIAKSTPATGVPRYILVAVATPFEDIEPPDAYVRLGYDVIDGTHSFLVGYGPFQGDLESIGRLRNRYGLLDSAYDVGVAVDAITRAWSVPATDPPIPFLLFEAEALLD